AMRPDDGSVVWQTRVGRGGALGGVHWGIAANNDLGLVYVPNSDRQAGVLTGPGEAQPGLFALNIETGEIEWHFRPEPMCDRCWPGLSSAITVTDEVVFTGTLDGVLAAVDAKSGELLWSEETSGRSYDAVNGGQAQGGAFDAHGPLVVDDLLLVSSGYGGFFQRGGNAFMVFTLPSEHLSSVQLSSEQLSSGQLSSEQLSSEQLSAEQEWGDE
ncbi:MAG: PQQ-binding-like beta-propeller repeat protein, partial [Pseudomonadota bacterium]